MSRLPTAVPVVSTVADGMRHGMTVNALTSVSLDPVLLLFCCEHAAVLHDPLLRSGRWGVSVLTAAQSAAAPWFAAGETGGQDQFVGWSVREGPATGAPLLCDALAWLECRTWATYDGGDHTIVVGEVLDMAIDNDTDPLIFLRSDYTSP